MNFIDLKHTSQIDEVFLRSHQTTQIIFKHSTRCAISSMVLNRLKRTEVNIAADFYYLDLIQFRELSNIIAERCKVQHESPQLLIIKNGICTFHASHNAITIEAIAENS